MLTQLFPYVFLAGATIVTLAAFSRPFRRFLKSLVGVGGAQLDKASDSLENADPLASYKSQINAATDKAKLAARTVEAASKTLVSLDRQIKDGTKEKNRLENRLKAVLANGDPNKSAADYALDLERVERDLAENTAQYETQKAEYEDSLQLIDRYERDISDARKDAERMGYQLEKSAAEKQLREMKNQMKNDLNLGELAETRRRLQERIDANVGASQAQRDLNARVEREEDDAELERKARAEEILARFRGPAAQPTEAPVEPQN